MTGLVEEISPRDVMHRSDPDRYFIVGREALETIERFMRLVAIEKPASILDLPCGHGRVLRFLRARFPDASITACDLDTDGVDFCATTFAARPVYSTTDFAKTPLDGEFDLIWCGSLLTHIHADQWRAALRLFADHLRESGLLIFTTHGRCHARRLRSGQTTLGLSEWGAKTVLSDYEQSGFGFRSYPGQEGYGISISSAPFVCTQVLATPRLRLAGYAERGWSDHQDAVACLKDSRETG
jgi:SAM-dependent methyltransferase